MLYDSALTLYRATENRYGESSALVNLADIGVDNSFFDDALRHAQAALALASQIGKRFDQAAAKLILGSIYFELGNFARAAPFYHESLRLFREMGNGSGESIALRDFAALALRRGDVTNAFAYANAAVHVAHQVGSPYREGMALQVLGDVYFATRDFARAELAYQQSSQVLLRAERGHRALDARAGLARVAFARGDVDGARQQAQELFDSFGVLKFYDSADPSEIYLLCYEILAGDESPRAREILQRGMDELNTRAAHLRDDALRQEFLEHNPSARALRQAHQRAFALPDPKGFSPKAST